MGPAQERWLVVAGTDGRYEVSSWGRVRALYKIDSHGMRLRRQPLVLAQHITRNGYVQVSLTFGSGAHKSRLAHHLVLEAFVGDRPPGYEASHLDGTRTNNRADNLAWESRADNNARRVLHGTVLAGVRHPSVKLKETQVDEAVRMVRGGRSQTAVAGDLGVHPNTINDIMCGATWSSYTGITREPVE